MRIQAEQVRYRYRTKYQTTQALDGVSCTFEPGTVYAITGRSGSGKSTFLSLLAGLDVPTGGRLLVDGRDLRTMDRDRYRREQVAVIYQAFHLFPLLTVQENVLFPLQLQGKKPPRGRAAELLRQVGLPETALRKLPNMLSGGEQQRVAIARAMASGAQTVLADEPTGNLDSRNEENIVRLLGGLARDRGCTVVIVTHSEAIAASADVVYRMEDGHLEVERA